MRLLSPASEPVVAGADVHGHAYAFDWPDATDLEEAGEWVEQRLKELGFGSTDAEYGDHRDGYHRVRLFSRIADFAGNWKKELALGAAGVVITAASSVNEDVEQFRPVPLAPLHGFTPEQVWELANGILEVEWHAVFEVDAEGNAHDGTLSVTQATDLLGTLEPAQYLLWGYGHRGEVTAVSFVREDGSPLGLDNDLVSAVLARRVELNDAIEDARHATAAYNPRDGWKLIGWARFRDGSSEAIWIGQYEDGVRVAMRTFSEKDGLWNQPLDSVPALTWGEVLVEVFPLLDALPSDDRLAADDAKVIWGFVDTYELHKEMHNYEVSAIVRAAMGALAQGELTPAQIAGVHVFARAVNSGFYRPVAPGNEIPERAAQLVRATTIALQLIAGVLADLAGALPPAYSYGLPPTQPNPPYSGWGDVQIDMQRAHDFLAKAARPPTAHRRLPT